MGEINLSHIVNLPAFEEAGLLFYKATGMTISFHDDDGNVVFYPSEERCEFCHLVQSTTEGAARCQLSDTNAAKKALATGKPLSYTCHAGLTDVVVPVVVGSRKVGCFYSGQSMLKPATPMGFQEIRSRVSDLNIDSDKLWQAYNSISLVDESRLQMAMGLLGIISNHLVEQEMMLQQERDLREMELRLLQAQLNPHFLFNALNLVLGYAMIEKAPQTYKTVEDLSLLLRNSLTNVGSFVSISEEISFAKAYVDIFRARFNKHVNVKIKLPDALYDFMVPSLILQPLVENSLVHALPACDDNFEIEISTILDGEWVQISVSDNGKALSSAFNAGFESSKLTGLSGLNRRLKYYYPKVQNLQLKPLSPGLCVSMRLPATTQ